MDMKKIEQWFYERFGRLPEHDKGYFYEWVNRFESGTAMDRMDSDSKAVWYRVTGDGTCL